MRLQTHLNDPRLRRVRRLSLGLRWGVWGFGAVVGVLVGGTFLGVGSTAFEGPSGYRIALADFTVHARGDMAWQDLALVAASLPAIAVFGGIIHQVERLLASYQQARILDGINARRIRRIGQFIVLLCIVLCAVDVFSGLLHGSLGKARNEPIVFELVWFFAGLVITSIGYAMGIACEIAEDAELTV